MKLARSMSDLLIRVGVAREQGQRVKSNKARITLGPGTLVEGIRRAIKRDFGLGLLTSW